MPEKITNKMEQLKDHERLKKYLIRPAGSQGSYFKNKEYIKTKLKLVKNPAARIVLPEWISTPLDPPTRLVHQTLNIPHPIMQEITSSGTFKIKLTNCLSPSQLSFQFRLDDLHLMNEEMNCYYNDPTNGDTLARDKVLPGAMVAAFNGSWFRAEIVSVADSTCVVKLLDYGTKQELTLDQIRHLNQSFFYPTRKFAKGRLFAVKPNEGNKWSPQAITTFAAKTKNLECYATIKASAQDYFELDIFKDGNKTGKSLSEYLIAKGFAVPVEAVGRNAILL